MLSDHDIRTLEAECPVVTAHISSIAALFGFILNKPVSIDDVLDATIRLNARRARSQVLDNLALDTIRLHDISRKLFN